MQTNSYNDLIDKINSLNKTIEDCNNILISDQPIDFIYENANFLTKSFLVNLCGYLETYLKDVLELLIIVCKIIIEIKMVKIKNRHPINKSPMILLFLYSNSIFD